MVSGLGRRLDDHEGFRHVRDPRVAAVGDGPTVAADRPATVVPRTGCRCQTPGRDPALYERDRPVSVYPVPPCCSAASASTRRRSSTSFEPYGDDRADPHHLRRDRPADRLLPPRRLAPLHRGRARRRGGDLNLARHPDRRASSPRSSATRSATRSASSVGPRTVQRAGLEASSSRSTSSAPRSSSRRTGRRRSCSPASCRSCARSPRSSPASARCRGARSSRTTCSAASSGRSA